MVYAELDPHKLCRHGKRATPLSPGDSSPSQALLTQGSECAVPFRIYVVAKSHKSRQEALEESDLPANCESIGMKRRHLTANGRQLEPCSGNARLARRVVNCVWCRLCCNRSTTPEFTGRSGFCCTCSTFQYPVPTPTPTWPYPLCKP